MRFQLLSDIHAEFHRDGGVGYARSVEIAPNLDALLVAGDAGMVARAGELRNVLGILTHRAGRVLYVPGNHEFYGTSPEHGLAGLRAIARSLPGLTILEPGVIVPFGKRRVLGCSLWFRKRAGNERVYKDIADFSDIREYVPWVYRENARQLKWLKECLAEGDVVLTHHLPSPKSVPEKYRDSELNRFFVCNVEKLILERKPAVWAHGHTHTATDYQLGATRVLCNPLGYPWEGAARRSAFDRPMVVELP